MAKIEIDVAGNKYYYNDQDLLHREDGPAVEFADGTTFWCINDKLHRIDGPAFIWANGNKEWYINGVQLSEEEFKNRTKSLVNSQQK